MSQKRDCIASAVQALPQQQRGIFLAIRDEEMSYAEIAARFNITVEQVETEFAAALVHLGAAVEDRPLPIWRGIFRRLTGRRR